MDGPCTLIEHFSAIAEPRIYRAKRHVLIDVIVVAIASNICIPDDWEDIEMITKEKEDWLKSFLQLPNGIPSCDTNYANLCTDLAAGIGRTFCSVD